MAQVGFFPSKSKLLSPPPDTVSENFEAGSKDFKIPRPVK